MNKLIEICDTKRADVEKRKSRRTINDLDIVASAKDSPRGFHKSLQDKATNGYSLITEIKKASPSKGLIRADFDPPAHAFAYEAGGAACLSVLTDEPYFQGADDYLVAARAACSIPCLRKDFMVDPWQVAESRALGADAILIIVAALEDGPMQEIESAAIERKMDVLIEVHDEAELERALTLQSKLIGVNNRDLRTFETDLNMTRTLAKLVPSDVTLISESGISGRDDCVSLIQSGVTSFLVGESLMRKPDIEIATRNLLGKS